MCHSTNDYAGSGLAYWIDRSTLMTEVDSSTPAAGAMYVLEKDIFTPHRLIM